MSELHSFGTSDNRISNPDKRSTLDIPRNSSNQKIEVYYLSIENHPQIHSDEITKPVPPPPPLTTRRSVNSARFRPELYHLNTEDADAKICTCRSPPELISKKRKSSVSCEARAEMYYISTESRKTPGIVDDDKQGLYRTANYHQLKSTAFLTPPDSPTDKKVITYTLIKSNENKFLSSFSPTPSPPLQPIKKEQAVTLTAVNTNNATMLPRSKALESFQRSMKKYRFYGY
ncbi:unnamed protein product [Adineta ricciae]|uniref:Uncharacterized protein n=1 Tax=Adineta ricciae TaxID=249248 RepID=A0A814V1D4_ADIRI|nr:unnamed protein product [Adineta ricciae]CAF1657849.1 unnamed protein product [Adineta ricciae]